MENLDIYITTMPSSRPADYYLSCLGGSVFIDFNNLGNRVSIVRISFDGYGCCNLGVDTIPLDEEDSAVFKKNMKSKNFNQRVMSLIVRKAISLNASLIWTDALKKYELI
ncbi:hypothetical protein DM558_00285 [Entomomonas moraniae]|uniref:Uncharacterized protein n=1 Tax=Entomomonas moraniae TaxID=2213226 RepID=A0A3Q9JH00_9GAMM|nr:hypothetical protein [Entomomonas moraniae]AZS49307.1 hypothetical protein DM558_00285 [Entomomonas moraniae]